jgi:steroid 5-alpha reductase family enzyme
MPLEVALGDALVPGMLLVYLGCLLVLWAVDTIVGRYGLYRYVWHPSLFRVAVFFVLFGAAGLLLYP